MSPSCFVNNNNNTTIKTKHAQRPAADAASIFSGAWLTPRHPTQGAWPPCSPTKPNQRVQQTPCFQNSGNTCFLNSALQCLLHCPPLISLLLSSKQRHLKQSNNQQSFCAFCSLRTLAQTVYASNTPRTLTPSSFTRNTTTLSPTFRPGYQEDAHEYIRALLNTMLRCEIQGCPTSSSYKPLITNSLVTEMQGDIHRIFGGALQSSIICSICKYTSYKSEPFLDLSLEINKINSISNALGKFTMPELLNGDNKYKCDKCCKLVKAVKRLSIRRAPNVLMIQLKRFDQRARKDSRFIEFPSKLDLCQYMHGFKNGNVLYQLTGIVVHQGSSRQFGHYVACVRNAQGNWILKDDCTGRQVNLQFVLRQKAYVLFYERIDTSEDKRNGINERVGNMDVVKTVVTDVAKTGKDGASGASSGGGGSSIDKKSGSVVNCNGNTKKGKDLLLSKKGKEEELLELSSESEGEEVEKVMNDTSKRARTTIPDRPSPPISITSPQKNGLPSSSSPSPIVNKENNIIVKENGHNDVSNNNKRLGNDGRNSSSSSSSSIGSGGMKPKLLIGGSGSARKAISRVFGMRSDNEQRKGTTTTSTSASFCGVGGGVGGGSGNGNGQEAKNQGNSSVFGSEGVDTWGGGNDNEGEKEREGRNVIGKRRRANDELDMEYDKGRVRKVKARRGSNSYEKQNIFT